MKTMKRLFSLLLVMLMLAGTMTYNSPKADALYSFSIQCQNVSKWSNVYVNSGSLYNTGCGIFSLINAVGCLTGKDMGVQSVANWAHSIGGYNVEGAEGAYRGVLYPKVQAKYGATYGFTVDCDDGDGYWETSSSTTLKNHLKSGGVAVGHVPSHFIAILEYNSSTNKYHIYDSYPTTARGTAASGGDCWVTPSQLATGKLDLDWFCLLAKEAVGPEVTVSPTTIDYGDKVTVTWNKVTGADSYWYRVNRYDAEVTARDLIPYTKIIPKTETTTRSLTFTAPDDCKYLRISIGANGTDLAVSTTKTVAIGPKVTVPTDMTAIQVESINADTSAGGATMIWNSKKGEAFTGVWWPAAKCTIQADGSYIVDSVYASGDEKNIKVTGGDIIIASHADATTGYSAVKKLKVGDKITLHGLYLDYGIIRGSGFILVNGTIDESPTVTLPSEIAFGAETTVSWTACKGATKYNVLVKNGDTTVLNSKGVTGTSAVIPAQTAGESISVKITPCNSVFTGTATKVTATLVDPIPTDITVTDTEIKKDVTGNGYFKGFKTGLKASEALNKFAQDKAYLEIRNGAGETMSAEAVIGTGYTVNIVDSGKVVKSYTLVVTGDCNGDGNITSSDYAAQRTHLTGSAVMSGAYLIAGDMDGDNALSASDYMTVMSRLSN